MPVSTKKPTPPPATKKKTTAEILEAQYGAAFAVLTAVPELKTILTNAVKGKKPLPFDAVKKQIENSDWWRSNSSTFRARYMQRGAEGGIYRSNVDATKIEVRKQVTAAGLKLTDTQIDQLSENAYLYGFTANQILQAATGAAVVVGEVYTKGKDTGKKQTLDLFGDATSFSDTSASTDILAYAKNMGLQLSSDDEVKYRRRLAAAGGSDGEIEAIKNEILAQAKSIYEPFAGDLTLTNTLANATAQYRKLASQLLEVPEDQIGFDDPLMRLGKGFISRDSSGAMVKTSPSDFIDMVKGDPRWSYTNNAKQEYRDLANGILTQFGFM